MSFAINNRSSFSSNSEIGMIAPYAGATTPTGFLACEGQAVSRSTYYQLFNVIGTTWGVGDGSTTFNIPDLRSAFLVGAGTGTKFTVNTDRTVGDYDDDQAQGHYHTAIGRNNPTGFGTDDRIAKPSGTGTDTNIGGIITTPVTDGTNGTPRVGNETKPNSAAVKYCIRYEPKTALQGVSVREIVYMKDVKAATTNGGTFTSGAWQTRDLNTTENPQSWCSLSTNVFTLQAGTYKIFADAPVYSVGLHKCKLRNTTDSIDELIGSAENDAAVGSVNIGHSRIIGIITITSEKDFEIQHQCQATKSTNGFGNPAGFGVAEIYTQVTIEKIGD